MFRHAKVATKGDSKLNGAPQALRRAPWSEAGSLADTAAIMCGA